MQPVTTDNAASDTGPPGNRSRARAGLAFASPAVVLLTLFMIVPFGLAAVLSFTNRKLLSPLPTRWVGFDNYIGILLLHDGLYYLFFSTQARTFHPAPGAPTACTGTPSPFYSLALSGDTARIGPRVR